MRMTSFMTKFMPTLSKPGCVCVCVPATVPVTVSETVIDAPLCCSEDEARGFPAGWKNRAPGCTRWNGAFLSSTSRTGPVRASSCGRTSSSSNCATALCYFKRLVMCIFFYHLWKEADRCSKDNFRLIGPYQSEGFPPKFIMPHFS